MSELINFNEWSQTRSLQVARQGRHLARLGVLLHSDPRSRPTEDPQESEIDLHSASIIAADQKARLDLDGLHV